MKRRLRCTYHSRAPLGGIRSADLLLGEEQMPVRDFHMGTECLTFLRQAYAPGFPQEQPAVQL